jgi:acetyl-CoA acetyltransferase
LFDEIVTVTVPQRRGEPITVTDDEGVREGTTAASLAKLRPAFAADGTVTAGSASQISDGAAAVVVMSRAKAEELGSPATVPTPTCRRGTGLPPSGTTPRPPREVRARVGCSG